jgi:hypothetical protein
MIISIIIIIIIIIIDTRYRNNITMVHIPSLYVRMWQCFGIKGYTERERDYNKYVGYNN